MKEIIRENNLVVISNGQIITSSLTIAEAFGKLHKHILGAIDNLECTTEFNRTNFRPVEYQDKKGEWRRSFEITRDGFAFIAMSFTGKKAAAFKERYIAEFNRMESLLNGPKIIPYQPIGKVFKDQVRHFKAGVQLAKTAGFDRNQALRLANRSTLQETGRDCLRTISVKYLSTPDHDQFLTASDLGKKQRTLY